MAYRTGPVPYRTVALGGGLYDDQKVSAELGAEGWVLVLEENLGLLARVALGGCALPDLARTSRFDSGNIRLRIRSGWLEVHVSGELFASLPASVLVRLA